MSAREMFEELGYKQIKNNDYYITYRIVNGLRENFDISFNINDKTILYEFAQEDYIEIELEELKAINQQIKELEELEGG